MASTRRWQDTVMMWYFALQIPSTICLDTQGVYPASWYPVFLHSLRDLYLGHYKDPFLANAWAHPWYLSVCLVEHFIEMPFFVWATIAYYSGAKDRPRLLLAAILYSVHTLTICVAVLFMALGQDFTHYTVLAPSNMAERLTLCSAYCPFIAVSSFCLWDSISVILGKLEAKKKSV